MRDALDAWGRARWPGCRVAHELELGECRIDMAFISERDIVGVEIKSGRDKLDRLDKQLREFRRYLPEVWVAIAARWKTHVSVKYARNRLVILGDGRIEMQSRRAQARNRAEVGGKAATRRTCVFAHARIVVASRGRADRATDRRHTGIGADRRTLADNPADARPALDRQRNHAGSLPRATGAAGVRSSIGRAGATMPEVKADRTIARKIVREHIRRIIINEPQDDEEKKLEDAIVAAMVDARDGAAA